MEAKIVVDRKRLEQKLAVLKKLAGRKTSLEILDCVFLAITDDNQLLMQATDLETAYMTQIQGIETEADENPYRGKPTRHYRIPVTMPNRMCIPVAKLMAAVKAVPKKQKAISIEVLENCWHRINGTISMVGMDPDDFPDIPDMQYGVYHKVFDVDNLDQVLCVAGNKDDRRAHIMGALLNFRTGEMVKTDGSRLHVSKMGTAPYDNTLVPGPGLQFLTVKGVKEHIGNVRVAGKYIFVNLDDDSYVAIRLLEGQYPLYEEIVNTRDRDITGHIMALGKKDLMETIKEAMAITSDNYPAVILNLNGEVNVKSHNPNIGEFLKTVPGRIKYVGEPVEVAFHPGYILAALDQIPSDETFGIQITQDNEGPCIFGSETVGFKAAIMPMRL